MLVCLICLVLSCTTNDGMSLPREISQNSGCTVLAVPTTVISSGVVVVVVVDDTNNSHKKVMTSSLSTNHYSNYRYTAHGTDSPGSSSSSSSTGSRISISHNHRRTSSIKTAILIAMGILFLVALSVIEEGRTVSQISTTTVTLQHKPPPQPPPVVLINTSHLSIHSMNDSSIHPSNDDDTHNTNETVHLFKHSMNDSSTIPSDDDTKNLNETIRAEVSVVEAPVVPLVAASVVPVPVDAAAAASVNIISGNVTGMQQPILLPLPRVAVKATVVVATEKIQQQRVHRNITLIVELRGELGNQLSVLANARITQLLALRKYPHIHIQIIGQHQPEQQQSNNNKKKWTRGRDDLMKCFPQAFANFNFEGGVHDPEFHVARSIQESWLTNQKQRDQLNNVRSFHFLDSLLLQQELNDATVKNTSIPSSSSSLSSLSKYSVPYLTATSFSWIDVLRNDWYYDEIREWLSFNYQECCSTIKNNHNDIIANRNNNNHDHDITFHYRNFASELKHQRNNNGGGQLSSQFIEISPFVAANVAFMNHTTTAPRLRSGGNNSDDDNNNDTMNIAISSRFESGTEEYITAFHQLNISSYYVTGQQSGTEGFCYLLQTRHELFGSYQSTYYRWATLLGNATINRLYILRGSVSSTVSSSSSSTPSINVQPMLSNGTTTTTTTGTTMETIHRHTTSGKNRTFIIEVYQY